MITPHEINVGGRNCLGKWTYEIQGVHRYPVMWLAMHNIIAHEIIRNLHSNIKDIKDMQIQITISKGSNKKLISCYCEYENLLAASRDIQHFLFGYLPWQRYREIYFIFKLFC